MRRRLVQSFARLALLGLTGAGLAGCVGEELRHGYQIDQAALATIKPGMSPEQVLQILGTPSTVSTVGNKSWYYISQNTSGRSCSWASRSRTRRSRRSTSPPASRSSAWRSTACRTAGVFDFIERTTPTSGADRAFLSQLFRGLTRYEPFGTGKGTSVVPGANRGSEHRPGIFAGLSLRRAQGRSRGFAGLCLHRKRSGTF